jgi:hypothetical protein
VAPNTSSVHAVGDAGKGPRSGIASEVVLQAGSGARLVVFSNNED